MGWLEGRWNGVKTTAKKVVDMWALHRFEQDPAPTTQNIELKAQYDSLHFHYAEEAGMPIDVHIYFSILDRCTCPY